MWNFPGSPVMVLDLPLQGAQCHDSIPGQEIRSLMPCSEEKKKKKKSSKGNKKYQRQNSREQRTIQK